MANETMPQTGEWVVSGRKGILVRQPCPAIRKTNEAMPQTGEWTAYR